MKQRKIKLYLLSILLFATASNCENSSQTVINSLNKQIISENSNFQINGKVTFSNSNSEKISIKATQAEIASSATISLINPATNITLATGLTDSSGTFVINVNTQFQDNQIFILEASKRLGGAGNALITLRTYLKHNNGLFQSMTTPNILINTTTTALSVISNYGEISPSNTIGAFAVNGSTLTIKNIDSNVTSAKILSIKNMVETVMANNQDPFNYINFQNGNYYIQDSPKIPSPSPTQSVNLPDLGINASLKGKIPFPDDNVWNQKIDKAEVDPNSATLINSIGLETGLHPDFGADWEGSPFGIPYVVVSGNTPKVSVTFDYSDESDAGPYPIPANAPIEGGVNSSGDRHIIVIDRDNWKLYETWSTYPSSNGYTAGSGAIFDLNSNNLRPAGWTSADAAGLPIFPGLVRYDEVVEQKIIKHALRFTAVNTRRAYTFPARHFASSKTSTSLPPMGMRVRLKANFDISGYPANAKVILQALKTYGMILADNGSNWYISGSPEQRWNDDELNTLKQIKGKNFEVVKMSQIITN